MSPRVLTAPNAVNPVFPFTAIVGQDRLKAALALVTVDPRIGGLLIAGPRGSAKSTVARSIADLTHQGHFVTLPLGASEDRLVGTLNLDKALGEASVEFAPGLLARADGGMLYVDEVNLLADHLVDLLLDVAASGRNHVERDGISHEHDARFVLVGTMNPDEGELRPQLLDRFGLMATVDTTLSIAARQEIVQRRLAYDRDPIAFDAQFQQETQATRKLFEQAQQRLDSVAVPPPIAEMIANRCASANVEGYRADIIMHRAASAFAALQQTTSVTQAHVDFVAEFVLCHRRKDDAATPPGQTNQNGDPNSNQGGTGQPNATPPGSPGAPAGGSSIQGSYGQQPTRFTAIDSIKPFRYPLASQSTRRAYLPVLRSLVSHSRQSGVHQSRQHRTTDKTALSHSRIDWLSTLIHPDNLSAWQETGKRQRLLFKSPLRKQWRLNLVLLDTSASTLSGRGQMKAKGVIEALSAMSYLKREYFSLVTFGNDEIQCVLTPQRAPKTMTDRLNDIPAGGGTPLSKVMVYAANLIKRSAILKPDCHIFLLTDGRTSLDKAIAPLPDGIRATVIDVESSPIRLGLCQRLASWLRADYWHVDQFLKT